MAFLFNVEGKAVFPNTETLLIEPFKKIWERDETPGKEIALEEFTYIEFMTSMRKTNPYRQYQEGKKEEIIRVDIISNPEWTPDPLVQKGMDRIIEFQKEASTTYNYYIAAKTAAENMQDFFMTVDVKETNFKTGNPIYKPRDITSALNDTEKILSNLKALEKKVEEELYEESKTKSGKNISSFAQRGSL